jgi:hypothetical protein
LPTPRLLFRTGLPTPFDRRGLFDQHLPCDGRSFSGTAEKNVSQNHEFRAMAQAGRFFRKNGDMAVDGSGSF